MNELKVSGKLFHMIKETIND